MSLVVKSINDALETQLLATLGSPWTELDYLFDLERNSFRQNTKRFGARPLSGSSLGGVTRQYTIDHVFEIVLTTDYVNKQSDAAQKAAMLSLFDKMSDILVVILKNKIGIPNIVLNIEPFSHLEPEFLDEHNVVVQRTQVTVRYREALT